MITFKQYPKCRSLFFGAFLLIVSSCSIVRSTETGDIKLINYHLKIVEEFAATSEGRTIERSEIAEVSYSLCFLESLTGIPPEKTNSVGVLIITINDLEKWNSWIRENKDNLPNVQAVKKGCEGYKL